MTRKWCSAVSQGMAGLALSVCAAAACNAALPAGQLTTTAPPARSSPLDQAAVQEARKRFDDGLVDYPSTRFRNVVLVGGEGARAFCGQLNTKNRAGGYGGWTDFRLGVGKNDTAEAEDRLVLTGTPTAVDRLLVQFGGSDVSGPRDSSRRVIEAECTSSEKPDALPDYSASLAYGDAK